MGKRQRLRKKAARAARREERKRMEKSRLKYCERCTFKLAKFGSELCDACEKEEGSARRVIGLKVCPQCSAPMGDEDLHEFCVECTRKNDKERAGQRSCPKCGARMGATDSAENCATCEAEPERMVRMTGGLKYLCPKCRKNQAETFAILKSWPVLRGERWCRECEAAATKHCPRCGETKSQANDLCEGCAIELRAQEDKKRHEGIVASWTAEAKGRSTPLANMPVCRTGCGTSVLKVGDACVDCKMKEESERERAQTWGCVGCGAHITFGTLCSNCEVRAGVAPKKIALCGVCDREKDAAGVCQSCRDSWVRFAFKLYFRSNRRLPPERRMDKSELVKAANETADQIMARRRA